MENQRMLSTQEARLCIELLRGVCQTEISRFWLQKH